jgi:rfaE bifunctional protein nucleotidyltransferase chain/domain
VNQNQDKNPVRKLLSLKAASQWAKTARRRGLRIVATNGCFDLLHFGHVTYLQQARQLGDLLVVGLNSDASVRRLKGPTRPLVPARQRAAVMAALACVDAVVIFPQTRATKFLAAVQPDIYVKGGDYRPSSLDQSEQAILAGKGTRVRLLPLVPGCSTSELVERIQRLAGKGPRA